MLHLNPSEFAFGAMGQQQSKEELLYENVLNGNIEAVKSLWSEGAGLEVFLSSISVSKAICMSIKATELHMIK